MARPEFRITFIYIWYFPRYIWSPFLSGFREAPRTAVSHTKLLNRETAETNMTLTYWLQSMTTASSYNVRPTRKTNCTYLYDLGKH